MKRTLKYTQIGELKIENEILNSELIRLRNLLDSQKFTIKDNEIEQENQLLKEKIEKLEEQLDSVNNLNQKEVDRFGESISKNQNQLLSLKGIITEISKNLQNKNDEVKKHLEKESEFMRKIESLRKENDHLRERIGQSQKEISSKTKRDEFYEFLAREDSFSDVELVKLKDLAHLASSIEFCFQVFEK